MRKYVLYSLSYCKYLILAVLLISYLNSSYAGVNGVSALDKPFPRQATFQNCPSSWSKEFINNAVLSGFFYTGDKTAIECFECQTRIEITNGTTGNPHHDHWEKTSGGTKPNCNVVRNWQKNVEARSSNKKQEFPKKKESNPVPISSDSRRNAQQTEEYCFKNNTLPGSAKLSKRCQVLQPPRNHTNKDVVETDQGQLESSYACSLSCQSVVDSHKPMYPTYSNVEDRLETFWSWPEYMHESQDPLHMAYAGFYQVSDTNHPDHARCFQCGVSLCDWIWDDIPWIEHARWSPNCNFVVEMNGQPFVQRIQEMVQREQEEERLRHDLDQKEQESQKENQYQVGELRGRQGATTQEEKYPIGKIEQVWNRAVSKLNIEKQREEHLRKVAKDQPKFPNYQVYGVRVSSFQGWPGHQGESCQNMAKAGWFHLNIDNVQCFSCGYIIKNWDSEWYGKYDPLMIHAVCPVDCAHLNAKLSKTDIQEYKKKCPIDIVKSISAIPQADYFDCKINSTLEAKAAESQSSDRRKKKEELVNYASRPSFAEYHVRVSEFTTMKWPSYFLVSAEELAFAGFFPLDCSHNIQCYSCGVVYSKTATWEYNNDPFKVHAILSPKCMHLNFNRTQEFIEEAQAGQIPTSNQTANVVHSKSFVENRSTQKMQSDVIPENKDEEYLLKAKKAFKDALVVSDEVALQLAIAGFKPIKECHNMGGKYQLSDGIVCTSCGITFLGWNPTIDLWERHRKSTPKCPFLYGSNNNPETKWEFGGFGLYSNKSSRKATFSVAGVSLSALNLNFDNMANAGLFYTGTGDTMQCYSCKTNISNWQVGDDPWIKHARSVDKCSFITGFKTIAGDPNYIKSVHEQYGRLNPSLSHQNSLKSSLGMSETELLAKAVRKLAQRRDSFPHNFYATHGIRPVEMAIAGLSYTDQGGPIVACDYCKKELSPWVYGEDPWVKHANQCSNCSYVSSLGSLYSTCERLATFEVCRDFIPTTLLGMRKLMANAGLFYSGDADKVHCSSCSIAIRKWKSGDNPLTIHGKNSPHCKYMHSLKVQGENQYIKNTDQQMSCIQNKQEAIHAESNMGHLKNHENQCLKIVSNNPHGLTYPEYNTLTKRIESFCNQGFVGPKNVTEMALAGFFFIDKNLVNCFCCGGHVSEWLEDDHPWSKHKLYLDKCKLVIRGFKLDEQGNEDMTRSYFASYENRLETFVYGGWPQSLNELITPLVDAGFFYTGRRDCVETYCCNATHSGWKLGDIPLETHTKLNTSCPRIKYYYGESYHESIINKSRSKPEELASKHKEYPLKSSDEEQLENPSSHTISFKHPEYNTIPMRLETFPEQGFNGLQSPEELAVAGMFYKKKGIVACFCCGVEIQNWQEDDIPWLVHQRLSPKCKLASSQFKNGSYDRKQSDNSYFDDEANRLETFEEGGWPNYLNKYKESLIKAGFFYTGKDDIVRCYCCNIDNTSWSIFKNPCDQHVLANRDCPFIINYKGNVSFDVVKSKQSGEYKTVPSENSDVIHSINGEYYIQNDNSQFMCVRHTNYIKLSKRAESFPRGYFNRWQSPNELAVAGLFYEGNDKVRCFSCDRIFHQWQAKDIPWSEHRRHGSDCKVVFDKFETDNVSKQLRDESYYNDNKLRLETYQLDGCPEYLRNLAKELAKAGFIYTGKDDIVRTYCCHATSNIPHNSKLPPSYLHAILADKIEGRCPRLTFDRGQEFYESVRKTKRYQ